MPFEGERFAIILRLCWDLWEALKVPEIVFGVVGCQGK